MNAALVVAILQLIIEKGVPAYISWLDGTTLDNPTLDDIAALKVESVTEKIKEKM